MSLLSRFFGIVESKSDKRIFKFNMADQKLKHRTIFKILICYIESAISNLELLLSDLNAVILKI